MELPSVVAPGVAIRLVHAKAAVEQAEHNIENRYLFINSVFTLKDLPINL